MIPPDPYTAQIHFRGDSPDIEVTVPIRKYRDTVSFSEHTVTDIDVFFDGKGAEKEKVSILNDIDNSPAKTFTVDINNSL